MKHQRSNPPLRPFRRLSSLLVLLLLPVFFWPTATEAQYRVKLVDSCLDWPSALALFEETIVVFDSDKSDASIAVVSEKGYSAIRRNWLGTGCYFRDCAAGSDCVTRPVEIVYVVSDDAQNSFDTAAIAAGADFLGNEDTDVPDAVALRFRSDGPIAMMLAEREEVLLVEVRLPVFPGAPNGLRPIEEAVIGRNERFQVTATWATADDAGEAIPAELGRDSVSFWFFEESNTELIVKVLDGCAVNGHIWVYAAGLTDVAVTLEVIALQDATRSVDYVSPSGSFQPILDSRAFPCLSGNE